MKHQEVIDQVQPLFSAIDGIDAAVLYGSMARGDATPNSDIDIGLIVNGGFDREALTAAIKGLQPPPDHVLPVPMRNKVVAHFHDSLIKLEMTIHADLASFGRDLTGSVIPDHLLPNAVLWDRRGTVEKKLQELQRTGYRPHSVKELVQKFIYEFDNTSAFHRRSDGYRALYFHQIALHCLVQLMNIRANGDRFQFLPRNLLGNIADKDQRQRTYALNGTMYLPEMNRKKRALLEEFYVTLADLDPEALQEARGILERIYRRDQYWNLRNIGAHAPGIRWQGLLRSSLPAIMEKGLLSPLLVQHAIHTIIDLRAPRELEENPYSAEVLATVRYVHAPFDPWAQPDWFKAVEYQEGDNQRIAYRFFALGCRESIKVMAQALIQVPAGKGAIIHCHAGKDRTGIVCALLHCLAGADVDEIMADYLMSGSDTHAHNLQLVLDIIEAEGGILAYLGNCGLSEEEVVQLKQRLGHA